ncbi:MAG: single-stranded DNA-binding protein [Nocardiopsaceae bacterium]|nr:single-stranded DNA-binding protein [Nocardiopsaceae bacterium]
MSNPTYVKLTGWVTKDPQLRRTNGDQTPVCTIRMGTASRWLDRATGEWREGEASYFDVVCWRSLAVNVAASLRKGHMATVHGTIRTRAWTDRDGNSRVGLEITANSVGHELTYGWSHYNRMHRGSPRASEEFADGEASRDLVPAPGPGAGQDPVAGQDLASRQDPEPGRDPESGQEPELGQDPGAGEDPEPGQPEPNPFDDYRNADGKPLAERVFGTGDEADSDAAGTSEATAGEPRLEEAAVPV